MTPSTLFSPVHGPAQPRPTSTPTRRASAPAGLLGLACAAAFGLAWAPAAAARPEAAPTVEEVAASDLLAALASGAVTSEGVVRAYLDRIARLDAAGPKLNAMLAVNPDALAEARKLDAERRAGRLRGPLHGLPIVVKDNIETADRMPTTSGSLALTDNLTGRDSPSIARLRAAGAIILGKTNLSEWANARSPKSIPGWSAVGGLTRNPYVLDRTTCGSSSGAGAAIAASLAAVAIGTETSGSIACPSSMTGVVGLKPTLGLVSRTHVIPNDPSADVLGPMGRNVRDVALVFTQMVGSDPEDASTAEADRHREDFAAGLRPDALKGVRLGVVRPVGLLPRHAARFEAALARLRQAGAVLVEVERPNPDAMLQAQYEAGRYELKAALEAYLATTPAAVKARTVADLVAFNRAHAARELGLFGQEGLEAAEKVGGLDTPAYLAARARTRALSREAGIDLMLKANDVRALVSPAYGPARSADPIGVDASITYYTANTPALAGYPHLVVPMGLVGGLPVGLSFIGPAYADGALLRYGYAFEATGALREPPKYLSHAQDELLEPVKP